MAQVKYSSEHLQRLRQFFSNHEINNKLRSIIEGFPSPQTIEEFDEGEVSELHISVIKKLIQDIYVNYRANLLTWAEVTKQTPIVDPEYLSMHLVSIFTGIPGTGTAARGFDLSDGAEVKSCSRAEQLGKCKQCGSPVTALEDVCGNCGSTDILRKFDSHWIFSLRTGQEVDALLSTPMIYLVLIDYEDIETRDTIRIRIWALDPTDDFVQVFFRDHYFKEFYEGRIERGETPAPCNLHPEKPLTKFLKPKVLFQARIDPNKEPADIIINVIDSEGICDTIDRRDTQALRRGKYFLKVRELGFVSEFDARLKELTK